jgi:hypothetical protein
MDPSPERLTQAARAALRHADEEALARNHDIPAGHLLLG